MYDRFSFYDFASYIIPGFIVVAILYWFSVGFVGIQSPIRLDDFGGSIVILIISYTVGHAVQAIGNRLEDKITLTRGKKFYIRFLEDSDNTYPAAFKVRLSEAFEEVFKIGTKGIQGKDLIRQRAEIYELCRYLVIMKKAAPQYELLNGNFALYRGMIPASLLGMTVSLLILGKYIILSWFPLLTALPPNRFFYYDANQLLFGLSGLATFGLCLWLFLYRVQRSARHLAHLVYRSFYVWLRTQQLGNPNDKTSSMGSTNGEGGE